jgi:hypothetical protein
MLIICLERINTAKGLNNNLSLPKSKFGMSSMYFLVWYVLIICLERTNTAKGLD